MKNIFILIISLTVLVSCGDQKKEISQTGEIIAVEVSTPNEPGSGKTFSASGKIEADQFANISTKVAGYVQKVPVKVGDRVNQGQLLVHINNSDMEAKKAQANAQISQAQAGLKVAENNYNRFKKLYDQKSASTKEFEDIQAAYDIAKAQVEAAQQMGNEIDALLNYSYVRAPFSGVITSVSVKEGDMALPGTPLIGIENPKEFIATALIPEIYLPMVKKDESVQVNIKSNQDKLKGKVREISTSSQQSGGQYLVKIAIVKNTATPIYSGMDVTTLFPFEGKSSEAVLVPKSALIHKGQLTGIYTVSQSNTAVLRWIRTGDDFGEEIEVLSGINSNEKFISKAEGKLYNGVKIQIK